MFSYWALRAPVYILLWITSLIVLALTGYRVHHTKIFHPFHGGHGFYDKIIVELLVTSALTLLWVPIGFHFLSRHRGTVANDAATSSRRPTLSGETSFLTVLWVMWLVGAAIATNNWPLLAIAGHNKQGHVLIAIIALSWLAFTLVTLLKVLMLMHYAAANAMGAASAGGLGAGVRSEKRAGNAGVV